MFVEFETRDHVGIFTLNRPEARNAVNAEVASEMEAHVDRFEEDPELWVGIIRANGPVFCAGADLKAVARDGGRGLMTSRGGFAGFCSRDRVKPVIAAVDGSALAGGTEISVACELVVASTISEFGIPEVKRSLAAAAGGLFRLGRVLPRNIAYELAITGDPISAEQAHGYGMVNELCQPGEAFDRALELAARITANAPLAVRESLHVMKITELADDETGFAESRHAMKRLAKTEDYKEGPRAFIEKRAPQWQGR